jgi:hypothetical protein
MRAGIVVVVVIVAVVGDRPVGTTRERAMTRRTTVPRVTCGAALA